MAKDTINQKMKATQHMQLLPFSSISILDKENDVSEEESSESEGEEPSL